VRLFAAVYPPERARRAVASAGVGTGDLRWVPAHQWHLTLAFYGEVADPVVPDLLARLTRAAARTPTFDLRLRGAGTFPRAATAAQVLWVGVEGDRDALRRLAERAVAAGRRSGLDIGDRRYRPHLTLGRARRPSDLSALVDRFATHDGEPWPVTSLHLVHSTIGATVRHTTLAELPLGGDGAAVGR
jgi:2'-5' RNA ligase